MEQTMELSDTEAEIWRLKEVLKEIYDEKKQICHEMLIVSEQLDQEISRYLKMGGLEIDR